MIDYNVYQIKFPNRANKAMVFPNDDGTFDIYLNTLYPDDDLKEALRHELRHLESDHFYKEILNITEIEAEADGKPVAPIPVVTVSNSKTIPCFGSLGQFRKYLIETYRPPNCEGLLDWLCQLT